MRVSGKRNTSKSIAFRKGYFRNQRRKKEQNNIQYMVSEATNFVQVQQHKKRPKRNASKANKWPTFSVLSSCCPASVRSIYRKFGEKIEQQNAKSENFREKVCSATFRCQAKFFTRQNMTPYMCAHCKKQERSRVFLCTLLERRERIMLPREHTDRKRKKPPCDLCALL